jgi:hypothetical protein
MTAASDSAESRPNITLRGGPVEATLQLPHLPVCHIEDRTDTYKLFMGNRYEHFVPTTETVSFGGEDLQVFVWAGRTFVAE